MNNNLAIPLMDYMYLMSLLQFLKVSSESLIKLYPVSAEKYISTNIITKVASIDVINKSSKCSYPY